MCDRVIGIWEPRGVSFGREEGRRRLAGVEEEMKRDEGRKVRDERETVESV